MSGEKVDKMTSDKPDDLTRIAHQILKLRWMFSTLRHKRRMGDPYDLSDSEFQILDILANQGPCGVGQLRKALAVDPAQMSRIIKSLESKDPGRLVESKLDPTDKRRINVSLTSRGRRAHREYLRLRLAATTGLLKDLSAAQRKEFSRVLDRFESIMSAQLG